jgi:predicted small secreted protein
MHSFLKGNTMRIICLFLILVLVALGGCGTISGLGQDLHNLAEGTRKQMSRPVEKSPGYDADARNADR